MKNLLVYLKAHRREKVSGLRLFTALFSVVNAYFFSVSLEEPLSGVIWGIMALLWLYQALFISDEERAMENGVADPRSMEEKLREEFAGLTPEELQTIIDDKLRSEETKAVARDLLEKMQ